MSVTVRRVWRAIRAALPAWMVPVLVVCAFIPGPVDEALVVLVGVVLVAVQPVRARRAASAWRGGKSHRAFDLAVA